MASFRLPPVDKPDIPFYLPPTHMLPLFRPMGSRSPLQPIKTNTPSTDEQARKEEVKSAPCYDEVCYNSKRSVYKQVLLKIKRSRFNWKVIFLVTTLFLLIIVWNAVTTYHVFTARDIILSPAEKRAGRAKYLEDAAHKCDLFGYGEVYGDVEGNRLTTAELIRMKDLREATLTELNTHFKTSVSPTDEKSFFLDSYNSEQLEAIIAAIQQSPALGAPLVFKIVFLPASEGNHGNLSQRRKKRVALSEPAFPIHLLRTPITVCVNTTDVLRYNELRGTAEMAVRRIAERTTLPFEITDDCKDAILVLHDDRPSICASSSYVDGNSFGAVSKAGKAVAHISCWRVGTVIHEICHTLGMHHEHNSPMRDNYVIVKEEALRWNPYQFVLQFHSPFGIPYNLMSGMHYGSNYFTVKEPYTRYSNRLRSASSDADIPGRDGPGLAPTDAWFIAKAYTGNFNECSFPQFNPCHKFAMCIDTEDEPPTCKCSVGYVGDGYDFTKGEYESKEYALHINYNFSEYYPRTRGCVPDNCTIMRCGENEKCTHDDSLNAVCVCKDGYAKDTSGTCTFSYSLVMDIIARLTWLEQKNSDRLDNMCDSGWHRSPRRTCLLMLHQALSWDDAYYACRNLGARLVSLRSEEMLRYVAYIAAGADAVHIGLKRKNCKEERSFPKWDDGSDASFTKWCPGEPNCKRLGENPSLVIPIGAGDEYCTELKVNLQELCYNDIPCNERQPAVCEKSVQG